MPTEAVRGESLPAIEEPDRRLRGYIDNFLKLP